MDNIVKFKRSSVAGKLPLPSQLAYGELAVNFSANNPFLSIKNNQDQIEKFLSEKGLMSLLTQSYYDKQTINQMFEAFDPSGEISFDNYYEKAEADAKFQAQSGMSSYLLASEAENLYQTKGNYLTEHQDISYLATKQELESYQSISGMSSYLTVSKAEQDFQAKGDYVAPSDLDNYLTIASASTTYATKEELEEHIPTVDAYTKAETDVLLAGKANSAHTHDYETLTNKPDLSNFATKGEIPDTNGFATKQELEDYQMKSGMTSYLTIAQAEQDLQPKGDYALQSQIPDTSNFITSGFCEDRYQPKGTYVVPSDLNNYVTSGYAEETFAKKGDVPTDVYTKSETDTLLAGKASSSHTHTASEIVDLDVPKIWKGTLEEYTNLTEIDNDTLYVITDESEQFVTSGDVESMISGFTNLTEVQTLLEGYSTTAHTHDYSEIQNTPDLSGFASLSDIPDVSNFITSGFTEDHYQPKGTYVVPSDLNDYALKSEIPSIEGLATEAELANYMSLSGMSGYSEVNHTHDYSEIQNTPDLSGYASLSDVPKIWKGTLAEYTNLTEIDSDTLYVITDESEQFVTSGEVESMISGFTNLTEVQTLLEGYSTTAHTHDYSEIQNTPDLSGFASLSDIPDTSNFITSAFTEDHYQPVSGMSDYVTDSELNTTLEGYSSTAHTHSYNDLEDKPTIPSIEGLASETWVSQNFQPQSAMTEYSLSGHTHSQYLTQTSADTRYARVVSLTQAEYDALVQNDQVEQGVLYCIIEANS